MRKLIIRRLRRKLERLETKLRDRKALEAQWVREIEAELRKEMGMEPSWIESVYAELQEVKS